MNYWNDFNASPGVEPAGMLVLDDVHLLESPLRDLVTVSVRRGEALYEEVLRVSLPAARITRSRMTC